MNLNTKDPTRPGLVKNVETIKLLNSTRCYMAFAEASKDYQELAQCFTNLRKKKNLPQPTAQEVVSKYGKTLTELNELAKKDFKSEAEFADEVSHTFYGLNWNMNYTNNYSPAELAILYDYTLHMRDFNIYNAGRRILSGYKDSKGNQHPPILQVKKDDKGNDVTVVDTKKLSLYTRTLSDKRNYFANTYLTDHEGYLEDIVPVSNPFIHPVDEVIDLDNGESFTLQIDPHPYFNTGVFSNKARVSDFPDPYFLLSESERECCREVYGKYCSESDFIESLEECAPIFLRNRHYHYLKDSCETLKSVDAKYLAIQGQADLDEYLTPKAFGANISGYSREQLSIQKGKEQIDQFESDKKTRNLLGSNNPKKDNRITSRVEEINDKYKSMPEFIRNTSIGDAALAKKTYYVNHRTSLRKLQKLIERGALIIATAAMIATGINAGIQRYANSNPDLSNPITISEELSQNIEQNTNSFSTSQDENARNYASNVNAVIIEQVSNAIKEENPDWTISEVSIGHFNGDNSEGPYDYVQIDHTTKEHPYIEQSSRVRLEGQVYSAAINESNAVIANPSSYDENSQKRLEALTRSVTTIHRNIFGELVAEDNVPTNTQDKTIETEDEER